MIEGLDHVVLTVADIEATCRFYVDGLGMTREAFGEEGRTALVFGKQKFNLHEVGRTFEPKASKPVPGSADFCLLTKRPLGEVRRRLEGIGCAIVEGPVERIGARSRLLSFYVRDPDGNLVEVANEVSPR